MAIVYDVDSTPTIPASAATSITWSHTIGSGSNRLLVILVSSYNGQADRTISATYNSVSATSAGHYGSGTFSPEGEIFIVKEADLPSTGAYDIIVTFTGNAAESFCDAGAISFSGVDQTTPTSGFASSHQAVAQQPTQDITSATGNIVVGAFYIDTTAARWVSSDTGTMRMDGNGRQGSAAAWKQYGVSQDGAATTTLTWSIWQDDPPTIRGAATTDTMGISVKADGGGGGGGLMWLA